MRAALLVAFVTGVGACSQQGQLQVRTPVPEDELELPSAQLPPARACYVGQDCMSLDDRPFELCRLSEARCDSDAQFQRVQE